MEKRYPFFSIAALVFAMVLVLGIPTGAKAAGGISQKSLSPGYSDLESQSSGNLRTGEHSTRGGQAGQVQSPGSRGMATDRDYPGAGSQSSAKTTHPDAYITGWWAGQDSFARSEGMVTDRDYPGTVHRSRSVREPDRDRDRNFDRGESPNLDLDRYRDFDRDQIKNFDRNEYRDFDREQSRNFDREQSLNYD